MNVTEIISYSEQNFNRTQATGLNCLIFLALREQTTIAYQKKEWGFDDIPEEIVSWCDSLEEDDLLELAEQITRGLLDNLAELGEQVIYDLLDEVAAAALATQSGKSQLPQAIEGK